MASNQPPLPDCGSSASQRAARLAALEAEKANIGVVEKLISNIRVILTAHPSLRRLFADELFELAGINPAENFDETETVVRKLRVDFGRGQHTVDIARHATAVDLMIEFFHKRKNQPASIEEIATAIKRPLATVRNNLYIRNKEAFQRVEMDGRETYWQLTLVGIGRAEGLNPYLDVSGMMPDGEQESETPPTQSSD